MKQEKQMVEIDVLSLIKTVWKRKFLIILTALVVAVLALGYSLFIAKPSYQSTTRIYVVNRQQAENSALTNQDLQAGSYLVKDYKEIILSQDVLSTVISELSLSGTTADLSSAISVSVPTDTRIVSITVRNGDPNQASRIANTLREVAAAKIIAVTKVSDVTTLEEAEVPKSPSSPNIRRNVVLGFFAGAIVMTLIVLFVEVIDDRVKSPEDIEEVMGLSLLGVVPEMSKWIFGMSLDTR